MLRIAQGHGILAGGTVVKPLNSISGQFSRVVRVRKGAYRVLVKFAPAASSPHTARAADPLRP